MKPKILILLQNCYGRRGGRMRFPVYGTAFINRRNATYSRILPYLEPHFDISFAECTPLVATNKKDKFPTDLSWVKFALEQTDWFAVLAFSAQAHKACRDLSFIPFACLPHPASFKWRRDLIIEARDQLIKKTQDSQSFH